QECTLYGDGALRPRARGEPCAVGEARHRRVLRVDPDRPCLLFRMMAGPPSAATRILAVLAAFFAGALALVAALWLTLPKEATQASSVGGPFRLVDQNGHAVSDRDFRGKPFIACFGLTNRPDLCPTTPFHLPRFFPR